MSITIINQILRLRDNSLIVVNQCQYKYVVNNHKHLNGINSELLSICKVLSTANIHYWKVAKKIAAIRQTKTHIYFDTLDKFFKKVEWGNEEK